MDNKQDRKSLFVFKFGLSAFLICWVCLLLVVLFTTEVIPENMIGQILYFSGIALICISFILGWVTIIYSSSVSASAKNASNILNAYFVKVGISYGISIILIWPFLTLSFTLFRIACIDPLGPSLGEKILFFTILAILSLTPLSLHAWFKMKLKGIRRNST